MADINEGTDLVFDRLLAARREEVVALQKAQADRLADVETRGQRSLAALQDSLPESLASYLGGDSSAEEAAAKDMKSCAATLAGQAPRESTALCAVMGNGPSAAAVGWLTPYYGTLHGSNGAISWQGYNPGNIDASCWASGAGSGLFGTGAGSFTLYMDWWFSFRAPENRNYAQTIYVPFNGFYIVRADDGWFDSKEAKVNISMTARGYQYNYKPAGSVNVLSTGDDNINVNDRFDGWRTMYYSDLLGADQAYLLLSVALYVYARGGGSNAQLNFADGNANYLGVPLVYVS
ncbi:hypothetical protein [Glutamicibacter protophormiae]|uniref:Uncharacterized protein n=1 Tax=Glutamicibacter protophormiae TaxID=37930 RepID=A0ABS4XUM9_GLUPR|nr:hypothetical protein [Glutamicibacter protophormiae]MBP2399957.1 hypothetical protein [Glutamicibacter protophormiae]GGL76347.1 hypothetical protein GCM10010038_03050 [Glutamicibacter protophormiae]